MKVVLNACYGGFSLSREAVIRAREISGNKRWGGAVIAGDIYGNGESVPWDYGYVDVPRNDSILVRVVEELGDEANGMCSRLKVVDIPAGTKYRITEYDGLESILTEDDIGWSIA